MPPLVKDWLLPAVVGLTLAIFLVTVLHWLRHPAPELVEAAPPAAGIVTASAPTCAGAALRPDGACVDESLGRSPMQRDRILDGTTRPLEVRRLRRTLLKVTGPTRPGWPRGRFLNDPAYGGTTRCAALLLYYGYRKSELVVRTISEVCLCVARPDLCPPPMAAALAELGSEVGS